MKLTVLASALAAAGICASVQAANVDVGLDFKSAYVATGTTCNDGWVAMPWVDVYGLKAGDTDIPLLFEVWGAMDLQEYEPNKPYSRSGRFQEIDLLLQLDLGALWTPCEEFSWSIGYLEYDYPEQDAETDNLVVFNAGYDCWLNPSFTVKYRVGGPSKEKCEMALAGSHGFKLDEAGDFGLSFSADVWYVIQADESELDDGFACADFTGKLSWKSFYVSATYVAQIDDDVLPDGDAWAYDEEWVFAVGASYSFE